MESTSGVGFIRRGLDPKSVHDFIERLVGEDLHAKRVLSLTNGVLGVLHTATLAIHAIGAALAAVRDLNTKHAIKQIDRLLSNEGLDLDTLLPQWVAFVVAARTTLLVAMDWTDFDGDDQTTLALSVLTGHGRATPLMWRTVSKASLKDARNSHEDALLSQLRDALPPGVRVTIVADRGFGDAALYSYLRRLGFDFVIRFRACIHVTSHDGTTQPASEWVASNGRVRELRDASVTADRVPVERVVLVHARGMKDAWCLASNRTDLTGAEIKDVYGKRFQIEETFRDTKDLHFGLGLSATHITIPVRRDRLLFLLAIAESLLTLLGAAGEAIGMDRMLKSNTSAKRQLSLFRQGCHWYSALPNMRSERAQPLLEAFAAQLNQHLVFRELLGIL